MLNVRVDKVLIGGREYSESVESVISEEEGLPKWEIQPRDNVSPPFDSEDAAEGEGSEEDESPVPEDENKEVLMIYPKEEMKLGMDWG
jgi:hypothetical protein